MCVGECSPSLDNNQSVFIFDWFEQRNSIVFISSLTSEKAVQATEVKGYIGCYPFDESTLPAHRFCDSFSAIYIGPGGGMLKVWANIHTNPDSSLRAPCGQFNFDARFNHQIRNRSNANALACVCVKSYFTCATWCLHCAFNHIPTHDLEWLYF